MFDQTDEPLTEKMPIDFCAKCEAQAEAYKVARSIRISTYYFACERCDYTWRNRICSPKPVAEMRLDLPLSMRR